MKEEYLLLKQAAFLLQVPKSTFEYYVKSKKLDTELNRGRRMVKVEELVRFVWEQLGRLSLAERYLLAADPEMFWERQPKKFYTGRQRRDVWMEYLTLPQVAYLLKLPSYSVRRLLEKNIIAGVRKKQGERTIWSIDPEELEKYVKKQEDRFSLALEFFSCQDSFLFWEKYRQDFQTNWEKKYKERNQAYREKKKIQKSIGRTD